MRIKKILFIALLCTCVASISYGTVLLSEDFEWGSDWNSSMGNTVPVANGWSGILMTNRGGSFEAGYVNSVGAKLGDRGFSQRWDQAIDVGAQDCWLNTDDIVFPNVYYVGYWFKIDPSWAWGTAARLKIIKTNFVTDSETWDMAYWANDWTYIDPVQFGTVDGTNWTGQADCGFIINSDTQVRELNGCWNNIDDGQWHYFIYSIDHSNSIMVVEIDGVEAIEMALKATPWGEPFESGVDGVTPTGRWNFGGNISNGGGGVDEQYTAYDNIIIATTKAEVEDFLGISEQPTQTQLRSSSCVGCSITNK